MGTWAGAVMRGRKFFAKNFISATDGHTDRWTDGHKSCALVTEILQRVENIDNVENVEGENVENVSK